MEWLVQKNQDIGHEVIQRTPWISIKKSLSKNKLNTIESNKKIACKNQRNTISTPASLVRCQYSRISIENCSNSKNLLVTKMNEEHKIRFSRWSSLQKEKNSTEYFNGRCLKRQREYSRTKQWDGLKKNVNTIYYVHSPSTRSYILKANFNRHFP